MKLLQLIESAALADDFGRVQGNIAALDPAPTMMVVMGAAGGEGVTTVAARLAVALANATPNLPVLLAEGNLRSPALAAELGLAEGPGLMGWNGHLPLPVQPMPKWPSVHVLPAGRAVAAAAVWSHSSELLAAAVRRARTDYAMVVWDAPSPSQSGDGLLLAGLGDGVLVVIEMDQTRTDTLRFLRDALDRSHTRILGSVLNRSGRYWPRPSARPMAAASTAF